MSNVVYKTDPIKEIQRRSLNQRYTRFAATVTRRHRQENLRAALVILVPKLAQTLAKLKH